MRTKIPKIDLLITFKAVAQYESYTRAAEELALTQSAVFRQIAALEDFLNVALFHHVRKRIFLSDAGRHYLELVQHTLGKLERDTQDIMSYQPSQQVFELAVTPTFSTHWLIPNLQDFRDKHPELTLSLIALTAQSDFLNLKYDAAIMREDFCSPWPDFEYLFEEELVPVCSRMLWGDGRQKLTAEELLEDFPLLHQSTRLDSWNEWFKLSGVHSPRTRLGPRFDLLSMLISAIRSNLGVALLPRFAIQDDLENGDLVIPCNLPMSTGNRFVLTYREGRKGSMNLRKFKTWIHEKSQEKELKN